MFYKTLSLSELKREFIAYDRDYFTEEGLEYIEEVMTIGNLDEPVELDVIAICGELNVQCQILLVIKILIFQILMMIH